jgi:hypothetical protein
MGQLDPSLVHVVGHRETLSLDARCRFRLPDDLAARLQQELGRLAGGSNLPPSALLRLAFYFVPGTGPRIFLYPAPNIQVAIERFENPPAGLDPEQVRAARDYFYGMMSFVEADRQNRLQIPDALREHAGINGAERQIVLVAHNLWLTILKSSAARDLEIRGRQALELVGPPVLDPVGPARPAEPQSGQQ